MDTRQMASLMQLELDHSVSIQQCTRIVYARIGVDEASEQFSHHGNDKFAARKAAVDRVIELSQLRNPATDWSRVPTRYTPSNFQRRL